MMMEGKIPPSNEPTPMQELGDALRPAVEKVRSSAPPAEAVERSIDRAQRLGPPIWRPSRRRRAWVACAAGIAFPFAGVKAVSIGPITSATLREHNWPPAAEADPHDIPGLIAAVLSQF